MSNSIVSNSSSRIDYIDFLKFIGLTGIMTAHADPPKWLMMLRNFDVPLMVILSSLLGIHSYKKYVQAGSDLSRYYYSRFRRLVFPTWIFLCFFFFLQFIITGKAYRLKYYIASFLLTKEGTSYVWIILIYLYSALMIPLYAGIGFSRKYILAIAALYGFYELAYYLGIGTDNIFLDTTFYYIIPYGGVLTFLGCNYNRIRNKKLITWLFFSAFLALGIFYRIKLGSFQSVQAAKYPPRCYYLSYGIAISFALLNFCKSRSLRIYRCPIVVYISKHSLWIYLWHILVLYLYGFTEMPEVWYVKLITVYSFSVGIVYAVNKILDLFEKNFHFSFFRYLRS